MRHVSHIRGTALAALVTIGGMGMFGCAGAQSNGAVAAPASEAAATDVVTSPAQAMPLPVASTQQSAMEQPASAQPADDAKEVQGNVAELQRMMRDNDLTELRTSCNGTYGASLLLDGKELTYYVALFQQKNFWRVIKTRDEARAETVYADFVRKSAQLADVELRRAKLAAQKTYTERQIALVQTRADRLQADLDVARQQQSLVTARQKQARDEAAALDTQKRAAQSQLRELRNEVAQLQRQAEQGLPRRAR